MKHRHWSLAGWGALAAVGLTLTAPQTPVQGAFSAPARRKVENRWEPSIVSIESTRMVYEYMQPWTKQPRSFLKTGTVIGPKEILTAAEDLQDRTLVRVQKLGRGKFWDAKVVWVDYHANLALLTVEDDAFWKGLKPVDITSGKIEREDLQLARWKNANLEVRKVDFNQFFVDDGRLSPVPSLYLEFDSDMTSIGGSAPVISNGKLAAISCQQVDNHVRAIPASLIKNVLEKRKNDQYPGLGYFPFYWQPTENTATHAYLKLPGEPRGVAVIFIPAVPTVPENLERFDIILEVDGFAIDVQGRYNDPDYGQLLLENLATRNRFAGDTVKIKVWRRGQEVTVNFQMPKLDYSSKLVPDHAFDQQPEFLMVGGLIFQPLNKPYLRSWGADWRRRAPFRMTYFDNEFPSQDQPSLVVLSMVLPDIYNLGYQDLRALVVDKVNGQKVHALSDLKAALDQPRNKYHTIEFVRSDSMRRMVLDANTMDEANQRILKRYGLPRVGCISGQPID